MCVTHITFTQLEFLETFEEMSDSWAYVSEAFASDSQPDLKTVIGSSNKLVSTFVEKSRSLQIKADFFLFFLLFNFLKLKQKSTSLQRRKDSSSIRLTRMKE